MGEQGVAGFSQLAAALTNQTTYSLALHTSKGPVTQRTEPLMV